MADYVESEEEKQRKKDVTDQVKHLAVDDFVKAYLHLLSENMQLQRRRKEAMRIIEEKREENQRLREEIAILKDERVECWACEGKKRIPTTMAEGTVIGNCLLCGGKGDIPAALLRFKHDRDNS